jgi:hypothetical protein
MYCLEGVSAAKVCRTPTSLRSIPHTTGLDWQRCKITPFCTLPEYSSLAAMPASSLIQPQVVSKPRAGARPVPAAAKSQTPSRRSCSRTPLVSRATSSKRRSTSARRLRTCTPQQRRAGERGTQARMPRRPFQQDPMAVLLHLQRRLPAACAPQCVQASWLPPPPAGSAPRSAPAGAPPAPPCAPACPAAGVWDGGVCWGGVCVGGGGGMQKAATKPCALGGRCQAGERGTIALGRRVLPQPQHSTAHSPVD